ncbi:MAG: aldehyde dehydrogenase family protein [Caldilineaceae bacterium]|nr:aldehyde dehydrogenase family protein [Caldilineaceae bacterium]
MAEKFKVTYATLSADNEDLQSSFDHALETVRNEWLGADAPMFIDGQKVYTDAKLESYSPINTDVLIATAQQGDAGHTDRAVAAAKRAFPAWQRTPWQERVAIIRKIADRISRDIFELSALMTLEVGKSRLEALGEVEETADLLRYYADDMEKNEGYVRRLGRLNPDDEQENNYSILRPYGVWAVISPFNFPMALAGAPIAAALVTGNTVVFKGAPDTPFNGWKTAELFADAGLPPGVFNSILGPDNTLAQRILDNPDVAGFTFTGSYPVGMKVLEAAHQGPIPRPTVIEMGGKNPTIISRHADLDMAATGVMRAAFGLDGQKCSACSRVYIEEPVYAEFRARLLDKTEGILVGDPAEREPFMGTVINQRAYDRFKDVAEKASQDGVIVTGGKVLTEGDFAKGYYVTPTIIEGLPEDHELVRNELFLPVVHLTPVASLEEGMAFANDTVYGLTAGFFSENAEEVDWFYDNIQAGTTYSNRAAGATTGAWPGIQAFGGWKASGVSGKAIGSFYTLPLYMHEQSRTVIG